LPKGFDIKKDIHLGLEIAIDLVEQQLGGRISFKSGKGLSCRILLKEELYKPRI
jgi:two-component sensor histidine kinase